MRIGFLFSRIRVEEKLLIESFQQRGVAVDMLDVREMVFDIHQPEQYNQYDVVVERCISQTQANTAVRVLEAFGVLCVNSSRVIDICGDKLVTSLRLAACGIPTPRVKVAVEPDAALRAIEGMGYPCVLKPTVGSWGRLLARINDRDAAEAVVEHKSTLGGVQHGVFYVQEHVDKPGRDIRVFMIGGHAIAAIERRSDHWITNTARGGQAAGMKVTAEMAKICQDAAVAVTGSEGAVLAIDLLESRDGNLLVSEINHTMEFRNSIATTGIDIPGLMVEYVMSVGRRQARRTDGTGVAAATIESKPLREANAASLNAIDTAFSQGAA